MTTKKYITHGVCLAASILLNFCNANTPDFVTSQGIKVYHPQIDDITQRLMTHAIDYYIIQFSRSFEKEFDFKHIFRSLEIHWTEEFLNCQYLQDGKFVDGLCSGLTKYHRIWVVWLGSIQESALFHELTHRVIYVLYGTEDYGHLIYTDFWKAEITLAKNYRPPLY